MRREADHLHVARGGKQALVTASAPVSGYALYGLAGPPVGSGESVVAIAFPERPVE